MDKSQALYSFWASFGYPTYDQASVPTHTAFPYITYSYSEDSLGNVVPLEADLWFKSESWNEITELCNDITRIIKGHGYATIPFDGGYIYLTGGTPFAQRIEDPDVKRIHINVLAEYLSEY